VAEEFHDRVGGQIGRDTGADIELRVDLDQVEADVLAKFRPSERDVPVTVP